MKLVYGKTIQELKNEKLQEIDFHGFKLHNIWPAKQRLYDEKYKEALSYLTNNDKSHQLLENAADIHNKTMSEMAEIIIGKSNDARENMISIEFYRETNKKRVNACETLEEIKSIKLEWPE